MIGYLFHLYKSGTEPFRNLSILSEEDAIQVWNHKPLLEYKRQLFV